MLEKIRCTCGRPLGDLYDAFVVRRTKLVVESHIKSGSVIDPRMLPREHGINIGDINLHDVFEDYCIDLICCRRTLVSSVSQHNLIEK